MEAALASALGPQRPKDGIGRTRLDVVKRELKRKPEEIEKPRFRSYQYRVGEQEWGELQQRIKDAEPVP